MQTSAQPNRGEDTETNPVQRPKHLTLNVSNVLKIYNHIHVYTINHELAEIAYILMRSIKYVAESEYNQQYR